MKKTTDKPTGSRQPHEKKVNPEAPGRFPSREQKETSKMPKDQDQYATIPGATPDDWHPTTKRKERDDFDDFFDEEE